MADMTALSKSNNKVGVFKLCTAVSTSTMPVVTAGKAKLGAASGVAG